MRNSGAFVINRNFCIHIVIQLRADFGEWKRGEKETKSRQGTHRIEHGPSDLNLVNYQGLLHAFSRPLRKMQGCKYLLALQNGTPT